MRPSADTLGSLIGDIYDAALDPSRWQGVLSRIVFESGAVGANLFATDRRPPYDGLLVSVGIDRQHLRSAMQRFGPREPWGLLAGRAPMGRAAILSARLPTRELKRTRFYDEVIRPTSCIDGIAIPSWIKDREIGGFILLTADELDPVDNRPRLVSAIAPHIYRALRIMREMKAGPGPMALAAVDLLAAGVFLVDRNAAVTFANRAAQTIAGARDGILLDGCELRAISSPETALLHRLIGNCSLGHRGGGALRVSRPSMSGSYRVLVVPISAASGWRFGCTGSAMIVVTDPERLPGLDVGVLSHLFGLTPTEGKVARRIGSGESVPAAARAMNLSINTVRSHLQRIFDKVGVESQSQLAIALVSAAGLVDSAQGPLGASHDADGA